MSTLNQINIVVDEDTLIRVLEAYAAEQDWGDYGAQLDDLVKDLLARNPKLQDKLPEAFWR